METTLILLFALLVFVVGVAWVLHGADIGALVEAIKRIRKGG